MDFSKHLLCLTCLLFYVKLLAAQCPSSSGLICTCDASTATISCQTTSALDQFPAFPPPTQFLTHFSVVANSSIANLPTSILVNWPITTLILDSVNIERVDANAFLSLAPTLRVLQMRNNLIQILTDDIFSRLSALLELRLDGNQISELRRINFDGLFVVRTLTLSRNRIAHLFADSFSAMINLETLHLDHNQIPAIEGNTYDALVKLRLLNLSNNLLNSIDPTSFHRLVNLEVLDLTNNRLFMFANSLHFSENLALVTLRLSNNNIGSFPVDTFRRQRNLQNLVISNNALLAWPAGLLDNLVELLRLEASNNSLTRLPELCFERLSKLVKLDLNNNQLETLPINQLTGLTSLKELLLSNNQMSSIIPGLLEHTQTLETADFSLNLISQIDGAVFNMVTELKNLNLAHNRLASINSNWFSNLLFLETLDLQGNFIASIPESAFNTLRQLISLNLNDNRINLINGQTFVNKNNLRNLNLARNPIRRFESQSFAGLNNLTVLKLNTICLSRLEPNLFSDLNNLVELHLSHNFIKRIENGTFSKLNNLKYLDLGNNYIEEIEAGTFAQTKKIETLLLNRNRLMQISEILSDTQSVKFLNLAFNRITTFNETKINALNALEELIIAGNPIQCDCSVAWLRSYSQLRMFENTRCESPVTLRGRLVVCFNTSSVCSPVNIRNDIESECRTNNESFAVNTTSAPAENEAEQFCGSFTTTSAPTTTATSMLRSTHTTRANTEPHTTSEPSTRKTPTQTQPTAAQTSSIGSSSSFRSSTQRSVQTTMAPLQMLNLNITLTIDAPRITARWNRQTNNNIVSYVVGYRSNLDGVERNVTVNSAATSATIENLSRGITYTVCVEAIFQSGAKSQRSCGMILFAAPSTVIPIVAPSDLNLIAILGGSIAGSIALTAAASAMLGIAWHYLTKRKRLRKMKTNEVIYKAAGDEKQMMGQNNLAWDPYSGQGANDGAEGSGESLAEILPENLNTDTLNEEDIADPDSSAAMQMTENGSSKAKRNVTFNDNPQTIYDNVQNQENVARNNQWKINI